MSYILDSLKKSEKERSRYQQAGTEAFRQAPYLEQNPTRQYSPVLLLVGFLCILFLILGVYFFNGSSRSIELSDLFSPKVTTTLDDNPVNTTVIQQENNQQIAKNDPSEKEVLRQFISGAPSAEIVNERQQAIALYEKSLAQEREKQIDALYAKTKEVLSSDAITSEVIETNESDSVANLNPIVEEVLDESIQEPVSTIPSIYELNSLSRRNIPTINYGAHIFATDNQSGFVILNGARARIGDSLGNGVFVEGIEEEQVILSFDGLVFSLPAMKSWNGE